jgi:hypothetical protein
VSGRFFESPSLLGSAPRKRGIPGAVSKGGGTLLMRDNEEGRNAQEQSYCQISHLPGKSSSSCSGSAQKEEVDGLLLCERHALEAKLEGQIVCWGGMLFHIDLWSREARRRKRPDVVGLLEDQRTQATSARQRAYEDLDIVRSERP